MKKECKRKALEKETSHRAKQGEKQKERNTAQMKEQDRKSQDQITKMK